MDEFYGGGFGMDMGDQMMAHMQSMMGQKMYGAEPSYSSEIMFERCIIPPEFAQEARFQPSYEDEEYDDLPSYSAVQKTHDFENFQHKLAQGTLDAQSLNLHQIPPSIFDNKPPITAIYLKNNFIRELPEFFFDELPSLTWIDVRDNKLTSLPSLNSTHNALRVMLLQGNKIRALPYSLGLAENLKTIGITGNPVTIPPEDIRKKGCKAMLNYMRKQMAKHIPLDEAGHFEPIQTTEEDEQLKEDLRRTAMKSVSNLKSMISMKPSNATFVSSKTMDERRMDRIKYTWDLWKRIPYYGRSRSEILQKSLDETRSQVMMKLNTQQEALLQKFRDHEALRKWRSDTRIMQMQPKPRRTSDPVVSAPFGNDMNHAAEKPTRILRPEEYQKEISECWGKLKEFAASPAPLSDVNLALQRLREVEAIHKRITDIKVSTKKPLPI